MFTGLKAALKNIIQALGQWGQRVRHMPAAANVWKKKTTQKMIENEKNA
jgi:hypothetical protein